MVRLRLRREDLEWRRVDHEVIAVDTRDWTYLSANGTGAMLWEALVEGATREQLVELLAGSFPLERARADADVGAFLDDLARKGLLDDQAPA